MRVKKIVLEEMLKEVRTSMLESLTLAEVPKFNR